MNVPYKPVSECYVCVCVRVCIERTFGWFDVCVCERERERVSEWVSKIERKYKENREENFIFQICVIL